MKRKAKRQRTPRTGAPKPLADAEELLREATTRRATSPALSGGDVDADWRRAESAGEEAVGGTVATPDQDVVDEIGRALGVERASDAEVRSSQELLHERDRRRWQLERDAADESR
jgi:Family of unknown function (DUF6335)